MAPTGDTAVPVTRNPTVLGAWFAAFGFVVFMVLELLVYEKGIGRALWISALAGLVLFGVGFWFARATLRAAR